MSQSATSLKVCAGMEADVLMGSGRAFTANVSLVGPEELVK
jgi:hypothetical protein